MEESKKDYRVSDANLCTLIEDWEQMPKRNAVDIAKAERILYAIAVLLPNENVLTAGKQSQDMKKIIQSHYSTDRKETQMAEIKIDINKVDMFKLLELKGRFDAANDYVQKSSYIYVADLLRILGIESRVENEEQNN